MLCLSCNIPPRNILCVCHMSDAPLNATSVRLKCLPKEGHLQMVAALPFKVLSYGLGPKICAGSTRAPTRFCPRGLTKFQDFLKTMILIPSANTHQMETKNTYSVLISSSEGLLLTFLLKFGLYLLWKENREGKFYNFSHQHIEPQLENSFLHTY